MSSVLSVVVYLPPSLLILVHMEMQIKTAAVLPALGIGDALLMMIASHHLSLAGYRVTTFHDNLPELSSWFPNQSFEKTATDLTPFDLIVAENDNSPRIKELILARESGKLKALSIFYPTYSLQKHGPTTPLDQVFNPDRPMAENIGNAIASLLQTPQSSKVNGIQPPIPLRHRAHPKRILIHPTSRVAAKNWTASKYITLAQRLKQMGFDPHVCVSPAERDVWKKVEEIGCALPHFSNLAALAECIYESGYLIGNDSLLGHLASNLNIPTLIIADDAKRMRLWRPGWLEGKIVLPPQWIPNPRLFRWKKDHWQRLVSVRSVLSRFNDLARPL